MEDDAKYKDLYSELEKYERDGVCFGINGVPASPMQIVAEHMTMREDVTYMRDYVMNKDGNIRELNFQMIKEGKELQ